MCFDGEANLHNPRVLLARGRVNNPPYHDHYVPQTQPTLDPEHSQWNVVPEQLPPASVPEPPQLGPSGKRADRRHVGLHVLFM